MTEYSPAKTGEYQSRVMFPNFQNRVCCAKYLKDNKHNSLYLKIQGYFSLDIICLYSPLHNKYTEISKYCHNFYSYAITMQIINNYSMKPRWIRSDK